MINHQTVAEGLREVVDPELGCNIVDLGLVYGLEIFPGHVHVQLTLTSGGCPLHEILVEGVHAALLRLDKVKEVDVELVWDPPWHPSMMNEEAHKVLDQW